MTPIQPLGGAFYWCPSLQVIVRGKTQEEAQLRADLMALRKTLKEA